MPFHQLHYTSCETGLSGHSGFQFCAMTPGVGQEIIREIERLTVYEPPRYLATSDKPVDIGEYPANLLYTVDPDTGSAIIARTVYVGVDFTHRSGNYFAHALVRDVPPDTARTPLPIELWDAPFWVYRQGENPELPLLPDSLPAGPITRKALSGISGSARETALGALLAAVDEAMTGGRRVVLVDVDAAAVCAWIAAACYLLGPELALKLTFATYSHDPRRCPTHVVGTIDAAAPFRADLVADARLFNFAQGIVPEVAPNPSASLLARVGIARSSELWDHMAALAPAAAVSLSGSFPVMASSALLLGHGLSVPEMEAAIEWLASPVNAPAAKHYGTAVRAALLHPLELLSIPRQADLVDIALRADMTSAHSSQDLASEVEHVLIKGMMARLDSGERPGGIVSLRTDSARRQGSADCSERLPGLEAQRAIDLLTWAAEAGARPSDAAVRRVGRHTILAVVVHGDSLRDLEWAAEAWPALRRGMLDRLAELPAALQKSVFAGPPGGIFEAGDFADQPLLHEEWLVFSALRGRISIVDACVRMTSLRRQRGQLPALDKPLLARLWPQRGWTSAEAAELVARLPADELTSASIRPLLVGILQDTSPVSGSHEWMTFVMSLASVPEAILHDPDLSMALELAPVIELIRRAAGGTSALDAALPELTALYSGGHPGVCQLINWHLPPLILRHARPSSALSRCPPELHKQFCAYAQGQLAREPHDIALAAWLYVTMLVLIELHAPWHARQLDSEALARVLPGWSRRDLSAVANEAEHLQKTYGGKFELWVAHYKTPRRFGRRRRSGG